jgi:hypothetical protein
MEVDWDEGSKARMPNEFFTGTLLHYENMTWIKQPLLAFLRDVAVEATISGFTYDAALPTVLQVASSDGTNTLIINALSCIHSVGFSQSPAPL